MFVDHNNILFFVVGIAFRVHRIRFKLTSNITDQLLLITQCYLRLPAGIGLGPCKSSGLDAGGNWAFF